MRTPRVVWAEPFRRLADGLHEEAATLRDVGKDDGRAELLDSVAERLSKAIADAAAGEWVLTTDAAPLLRITEDAVRARCRRTWAPRGLAKRDGSRWYVHVAALPGVGEAA